VKPNEDFLANHNGNGQKVNQMALINYHLNRNSSYSASYLLKAMAFMKWAKTVYTKTAIAGLSQGGAATLYMTVISQPDIALIASGHSVLFNDVNIGGANQLLAVPGYVDLFQAENLRSELQNSKTNYFFSWGKMEGDYYGIESSDKLTASWIEDLKNVDIAIHNGGHEFPVKEIQEFLIKVTN
jgi:predicted esterase